MVAGSNDAAVAYQHRRGFNNGALKQFAQFAELAHFLTQRLHRCAVDVSQLRAQLRQLLEGVAHTRQVARAGGTQRQTCQNTLQIAHLAQHRLQLGGAILQRADGLLTLGKHFRVAHRHMQPAFQHATAHRRDGAVKHRGQRAFNPACKILGDLQITARRGIHNNGVLLTLHSDRADVGQGSTLRIFDVLQQAAGGAQAARGVLNAEANQITGAKLHIELLAGSVDFELPQRATAQTAAAFNQRGFRKIFRIEQFGRVGALQFSGHGFAVGGFTEAKTPGADIQRGVAKAFAVLPDGSQQVILALLQQRFIADGARRDDAYDLTLNRPFAGGRIANLFANRH